MTYGLLAYGAWGLIPLYYHAIMPVVGSAEIMAHRIVWSVVFLAGVLSMRGQWPLVAELVRRRRTLLTLLASTVLIAGNWFTFIYAVESKQVLQASLGYFINPLVSILLGFVFLGERLRAAQQVAVVIAFSGVLYLTIQGGQIPTISLILAFSFGLYGLLRKVVPIRPQAGLLVETTLLSPLAVGYMVYLAARGEAAFLNHSRAMDLLLLCNGLITTLPLIWFTNAAMRLRLATIGFMQYLAPTGQFLLAVLAFDEAFDWQRGLSFALIWIALAVYTSDAIWVQSRRPRHESA